MNQKGYLVLKLNDFQSQYFGNKQIFIQIYTKDKFKVSLTHEYIRKQKEWLYFYLPVTQQLQIIVFQNDQKEKKQGYFNLPMQKIYNYAYKQHNINIKTILRHKKNKKLIQNSNGGTLKVGIMYNILKPSQYLSLQLSLSRIQFSETIKSEIQNQQISLCIEMKDKGQRLKMIPIQMRKYEQILLEQIETTIKMGELIDGLKFDMRIERQSVQKEICSLLVDPYLENWYTSSQKNEQSADTSKDLTHKDNGANNNSKIYEMMNEDGCIICRISLTGKIKVIKY